MGVGAEGFVWSGRATIHNKQEWPDWYPPVEMMARKPELQEEHMGAIAERSWRCRAAPKTHSVPARYVSMAGQQRYSLPHPRHQ